jgi:hypothetical protein
MPAPSVATYSATALVAAQTSFRDIIDTGSGTGSIKIRTAADVLLATYPLLDPCGTVNGTTGRLTFSLGTRPNAVATGTAAYGEICDVAGAVQLALPTQAGGAAVNGFLVLNTLSLVSGGPVEILSATIG